MADVWLKPVGNCWQIANRKIESGNGLYKPSLPIGHAKAERGNPSENKIGTTGALAADADDLNTKRSHCACYKASELPTWLKRNKGTVQQVEQCMAAHTPFRIVDVLVIMLDGVRDNVALIQCPKLVDEGQQPLP